MSLPRPFEPLRILAELTRQGVDYVVIGGIAAALHGSPSATFDLAICYAREQENLVRLAATLHELNARLRVARDHTPLPFRLDPRTLRAGDSFTFETDAGPFEILGTPTGSAGYSELAAAAVEMELGGSTTKVASLDSLIAMKQAAGRPKDVVELEILHALREEIEAKQALNEAIRAGARRPRTSRKFESPTFDMGALAIPLDKALRLAADLEDEELIRKLAGRK